ncbi:MAG TPA: riboflavin synthase, partial [Casimicrobiaceae bacterium]|nr:riboflavin synthase [Casimicrobiaceae bacterium]
TLACTAGLDAPGEVNLEKALRVSDRLGGHLVSGHVDGVGTVARADAVGGEQGSRIVEIDAPGPLARFIAGKGSIAIDGVSLTVNEVAGSRFAVNLIPHTRAVTTLGRLKLGDRVNLEVDMLARYVARLIDNGPQSR